VNLRTFLNVFFQNPKKRDFLRFFFEWLTTFSRTLADGYHDVGGLYYCNGNRTQSKN